MKKFMYLAACAAAVLTSCSNEENTLQNPTLAGHEPVVLSAVYGNSTVETRASGTVGDVEGGNNVFQYEDLYVLMTNIPSTNPDEWSEWGFTNAGGTSDGTTLGLQFDNTFFCRPEVSASNVSSLNYMGDWGAIGGTHGVQKYYPVGGSSDFFAYYIDDAAKNTTATGNPVLEKEGETMTLAFEMNGSQDIMVGKAADPSTSERGYSAKTARAGVIPEIAMKHALTRLTFEIVSGHENAKGVYINSLAVETQTKGKLTVAYNAAGQKEVGDLVSWSGDAPVLCYLMQKPSVWTPSLDGGKPALEPFSPVVMGLPSEAEGDQLVGEALFVKPGETSYNMTLSLTQFAKVAGAMNPEPQTIIRAIKIDGTSVFEAGKSYHVKVIVYGLSDIRINASLEAWKDGGTVPPIDTAN